MEVTLLPLLVLALATAAPRCPPPPPPSSLPHGIFVVPIVVHEGEQAFALVSTLQDQVQLQVRDRVSGADVYSTNVVGTEQTTYQYPWLAAGWTRAEPLPSLPPGIYQVMIPGSSVSSNDVSRGAHEAPLLVLPSTPTAEVLLVFDAATWQAYNDWGGFSLYTATPVPNVGRLRPGFNNATLFMARLAQELDSLGIGWGATDTDYVEDHPGILGAYRLVVLVQSFEYVSRAFREQLAGYFDAGGRVLAIGVEFSPIQARREGDLWTCYKFPHRGTDPVLLDADPANDSLASYEWVRVGEPETRLFGTSYWLGGWPGAATAWTVHRSAHWLWNGTGLQEGASLTDVAAWDLIDGTLLQFEGGLPYVDDTQPTETPADFMVLATVPTVNANPWWCWLAGTPKNLCKRPGWGVIGIRHNAAGGLLLVLPDWKWLTDAKWLAYPEVPLITRNALQVLAAPGPVDAYGGYTP